MLVAVVAIAIVALVFAFALPQIASYGAVWHAVSHVSAAWSGALVGVALLNVVTFAFPWMVALPRLGFVNAVQMTQASTAFTFVVPGGAPLGMGVSFGMLRSWGFGRAAVARAVALTGIWNQLSTFLFPAVAAVAVAAEGKGGGVGAVAVIAAVVFVVCVGLLGGALCSERVLRRLVSTVERVLGLGARLIRRRAPAWSPDDVSRFRRETLDSLRVTWPALTWTTILNQLTAFALLDLSLRAVGIGLGQVDIAESFAAWSVGRLLASLPLTPGGLGFVELGLTGMLVGFGGGEAKVVAAVLVYRVLSIASTSLVGVVGLASWNLFRPRTQ